MKIPAIAWYYATRDARYSGFPSRLGDFSLGWAAAVRRSARP